MSGIEKEATPCIHTVSLPGTEVGSLWDVHLQDGTVASVSESKPANSLPRGSINGNGALLAPSLCHPHIHLDKAYLLSHPKYARLQVEKGDFQEAMDLTGQAKARFEHADLLERGQRVIDESVAAGVTHMRAFVEVDAGVGRKCLEAGIALKRRAAAEGKCVVQLCAFAQLPLFSPAQGDEDGEVIRRLMEEAAEDPEVEALGSTPYVEGDRSKMERNVGWMVELSGKSNKHLDFHLDYNLDPQTEPLVWHVVRTLQRERWAARTQNRTVVLGHCTRLTLFNDTQWRELASTIAEAALPISFVGLPTSDLFMMRTGSAPEVRGTLDIPTLIKAYALNACIGANNIGNAFTPHGSCDPLTLATHGVGVYQAGTQRDAELLYECVSTRAKAAIGLDRKAGLSVEPGDRADLVLFGGSEGVHRDWRTRKSPGDAVYLYDGGNGRRVCFRGSVGR